MKPETNNGSYLMVLEELTLVDRSWTEVISIDSDKPLPSCLQNLSYANFSVGSGSGAALSDGTPLVCTLEAPCFKYLAEDDSWVKAGSTIHSYKYRGQAYNEKKGLVLAGGRDNETMTKSCVENSRDGDSFDKMKELPGPIEGACLASLDDHTLFLTGGGADGNDSKTDAFLIKVRSDEGWVPKTDMLLGRRDHSCGAVSGPDGKIEVVVTGGRLGDALEVTDTTVIYNVEKNEWRDGQPLGHRVRWAASVQLDYTFLVVGGLARVGQPDYDEKTDKIFKYSVAETKWELLPKNLTFPSYDLVAFMVPASIFPACNSTMQQP